MSRQVSRKNNHGQATNMVAYQEQGRNRNSRGISTRQCNFDADSGQVSYNSVIANERYKENKKSSHVRQTFCETSSHYSPEDSALYSENHLVSRQAKFTNYAGKPKTTVKTVNLYRSQYESPEESWTSSHSRTTVSNGRRTKTVEQSSFEDGASHSIDFGNSSKKAITSGGGSRNTNKSVARYGNHSNWDYQQEQRNVDNYLDNMFSSLSLER